MSILIGHASIDENGKASGGQAGDSTKKEVCTRTWYYKPWQYYLECTDDNIANIAATYMEQICTNDNVGYDQGQRLTLYNQLKSHKDVSKLTPCECDCSSLVACCYIMAGLSISSACTTRNIRSALLATGKFKEYSDTEHLTSDKYAKRGGLYLKEGSHIVMALGNGTATSNVVNTVTNISSATINGIDVSSYQGNIDWKQVKANGVQFAILRSTLKNGSPDTKFTEYLKGCDDNGIDVSVYKYSYALTEKQSIAEANTVISLLNGRKCKIWLDLEDKSQIDLGKTGIAKIANAFIKTCNENGYSVGIYCNLDWINNYIDDSLKKYDLWITRYGKNNGLAESQYKPNVNEKIWQYSSVGKVSGINGNVDVDLMYGELDLSILPISSVIKNIVNVSTSLRIRKSPNTSSSIVGKLKNGDTVQIIGYQNGWYQIGSDQWVSAQYIISTKGKVTASVLNVRSGAGTSYSKIGSITKNKDITILNQENDWYYILYDSKIGWVSSQYVQLV